jgi:hypothetical protein
MDRTFLYKFESIGDTCEFGIVQRKFGAEPISLMRWMAISPNNLLGLLSCKFEGVGEPEFTTVGVSEHGEFYTLDKRFHMFSHTFQKESEISIADFSKKIYTRLQYLKNKLLSDIVLGEKIFVYSHQDLNIFLSISIFDLLKTISPNCKFLAVGDAKQGFIPGQVIQLEDNFCYAALGGRSTRDDLIRFTEWESILNTTNKFIFK